MSDRNIRWAVITKASADKGPHKLCEVECDGKKMDVFVGETYGVQGSPHVGAHVLVATADGDEGKAIIIASMPRPKDRVDGQKEGEVTYKNHETENEIQHDKDGNTHIKTKKGTHVLIDKDGHVGVKPGSGGKVYLGDINATGMQRVVTEGGPSTNVYAKV